MKRIAHIGHEKVSFCYRFTSLMILLIFDVFSDGLRFCFTYRAGKAANNKTGTKHSDKDADTCYLNNQTHDN